MEGGGRWFLRGLCGIFIYMAYFFAQSLIAVRVIFLTAKGSIKFNFSYGTSNDKFSAKYLKFWTELCSVRQILQLRYTAIAVVEIRVLPEKACNEYIRCWSEKNKQKSHVKNSIRRKLVFITKIWSKEKIIHLRIKKMFDFLWKPTHFLLNF